MHVSPNVRPPSQGGGARHPSNAATRVSLMQTSELLISERAQWCEQFQKENPHMIGVSPNLVESVFKEVSANYQGQQFLGRPLNQNIKLKDGVETLVGSLVNDWLQQALLKAKEAATNRKSNQIEMKDIKMGMSTNRVLDRLLKDKYFIVSAFDPIQLGPSAAVPDYDPSDLYRNVLSAYALELSTLNEIVND